MLRLLSQEVFLAIVCLGKITMFLAPNQCAITYGFAGGGFKTIITFVIDVCVFRGVWLFLSSAGIVLSIFASGQ